MRFGPASSVGPRGVNSRATQCAAQQSRFQRMPWWSKSRMLPRHGSGPRASRGQGACGIEYIPLQ